VADPISTVRHIYEYHSYEFTGEFETNMQQWLAENRQHQHGAHNYSLEEYSLNAAQVKLDFADYSGDLL
jgi:hypothetical protein